jgi:hypothetical protein
MVLPGGNEPDRKMRLPLYNEGSWCVYLKVLQGWHNRLRVVLAGFFNTGMGIANPASTRLWGQRTGKTRWEDCGGYKSEAPATKQFRAILGLSIIPSSGDEHVSASACSKGIDTSDNFD